MASEKPLLLVDGSSYLFRAFHALPDLRTLDGFPTGAVRGVIGMLKKLQNDFEGSPVAVVFDSKGKTFRDDLYPEYKANRTKMADDLRLQIEPIFEIVRAMGLPLIIEPGVEADDVIGTLAQQATATSRPAVISTGDKDMAQLVSPFVTIVDTMNDRTLDRTGVEEKFGVPPELIIDYLALMGDSIDNIPGVPKVGPKTAAKWLKEWGSLDEVMANAEAIKGKVGENLRDSLDFLPLSRELTTIKCDVELDLSVGDLVAKDADTDELIALFERYEFKPWIEELGGTPAPAVEREVVVVTDESTLASLIDSIREAGEVTIGLALSKGRVFEMSLVGIGLSIDGSDAYYVPVAHDLIEGGRQLSLSAVLETLSGVLEDPALTKGGHDLKLVSNVLGRYGIDVAGLSRDTMLESYVLDSVGARRHHLDDLAQKYLGETLVSLEDVAGKGVKQLSMEAVGIEQAAAHVAGGAAASAALHSKLRPRLDETGRLASVYDEIELPLVSVLKKVETTGALVDAGLLAEQSASLAERMEALQEAAYAEAGEPFNLGSPKQLQEILFDKLGLPALRKTQKGQRSTAEDVLEELALDYDLPRIILDYRSVSKLKSTYTDSLPLEINQRTGRIHTSYNQAVAATGRLSSADPNLQNIPIRTPDGRRIRQSFVAPAGKRIVAADYSQIELRIMAHLSRDEGLLRAFSEGLDVHRATAGEVFETPHDEVSDDQRRSAKAVNFGLIYGMSAFGLAKQLGVTRNVAQEYIDRYFQRFPGVAEYMQTVRGQAHDDGFVETVFGRRLYLPEINARQAPRRQAAERTAINAPMQGTAADIIKRAMIMVDDWIEASDLDVDMVMQVHDELVFEVAEDDVEAVVDGVTTRMCSAADLTVELVVDAGVGINWDEAH